MIGNKKKSELVKKKCFAVQNCDELGYLFTYRANGNSAKAKKTRQQSDSELTTGRKSRKTIYESNVIRYWIIGLVWFLSEWFVAVDC